MSRGPFPMSMDGRDGRVCVLDDACTRQVACLLRTFATLQNEMMKRQLIAL